MLADIIQSFQCAETCRLFVARKSRRWNSILAVALRKLDQLNAAAGLADLAVPPGNKLELLRVLARDSTAFASTISGAFVSCGWAMGRAMLRLWTTTEPGRRSRDHAE
jgi:hypothetical protein